jgi:hypothetical protein
VPKDDWFCEACVKSKKGGGKKGGSKKKVESEEDSDVEVVEVKPGKRKPTSGGSDKRKEPAKKSKTDRREGEKKKGKKDRKDDKKGKKDKDKKGKTSKGKKEDSDVSEDSSAEDESEADLSDDEATDEEEAPERFVPTEEDIKVGVEGFACFTQVYGPGLSVSFNVARRRRSATRGPGAAGRRSWTASPRCSCQVRPSRTLVRPFSPLPESAQSTIIKAWLTFCPLWQATRSTTSSTA